MTMVWKRIKRTGHEASRYNFTLSFKELVIDCDKQPDKAQVACMHRRRRYACDPRPLEKSFSSDNKFMLTWPELASDIISLDTTLFKDPNKEQFENKEWTLIVEEITKKGKTRPIAAVALNLCFFVHQTPDVKTELKLKLRCLQKDIHNCTLSLILSSTLLKEGQTKDEDLESNASVSSVKIPIDIPLGEEENDDRIAQDVHKITKDFDDWRDERPREIVKPAPLPAAKQAWGEPIAERRSSRDQVPVIPPHRSSVSSHSRPSHDEEPRPSISSSSATSAVPEKLPSIYSVVKDLPPPPPTPIPDESLLDWCKRVTKGYKNVRVKDLSKSWLSGLAFCAILHRYDPNLIGKFERLDFSGTKPGQKDNCRIAFDAAETIGVKRTLDESEISIYPDEKQITAYLRNLRAALQGPDFEDTTDNRKSDYRFSKVYGLSETEENVVKNIERMRLMRGADASSHIDTVKNEEPVKVTEGKVTSKFRMTSQSTSVEDDEPKAIPRSRRDSIKELDDHQAELQRMADEMKFLADQAAQEASSINKSPPPPAPIDHKHNGHQNLTEEEQAQRRREEARRLIDELNNTGDSTIMMSSIVKPNRGRPNHHQNQQYNFYSVRSAQASPALERKTYGHQRHGSDFSANAYPSTSSANGYYSPHNAPPGALPPSTSAFDRVKRYGSMRSAELAEALSQYIGPMMETSTSRAQPYDNSLNATPTRKIITSFERNVINVDDISEELKRITDRISEVENLQSYVEEKIRNVEPGSEDEQKYMIEHMKLLNEKDALVRKQDYFNVAAEMNEVAEKLAIVQQQVNEVTTNDDTDKTEEEKQRIDNLVEEYKNLIDKKNELAEILVQKEAEEEEHNEHGRRTLERSQNFLRGSQEPLNTSRRIMNWIKSTTNT